MQEKGLIPLSKTADPKPTPRYDSVDLEGINMLYGVKPNGEEKTPIEKAHPEPCIIAPSYDRVNGLVENPQEAQEITINWILSDPHAKYTQHRYAQNELLQELITLGFFLDNAKEDELRVLADSCAEELDKTAAAPLAALVPFLGYGAVAAAVALPLIGVYRNFIYLAGDLPDVINDTLEAIAEYKTETPALATEMDELSDKIKLLRDLYQNSLAKQKEILNVSPTKLQPNQIKEGEETLDKFLKAGSDLIPFLVEEVAVIKQFGPHKETGLWGLMKQLPNWIGGSSQNILIKTLEGTTGHGGLIGTLKDTLSNIAAHKQTIQRRVKSLLPESEKSETKPEPHPEEKIENKPTEVKPEPPPKSELTHLLDQLLPNAQ